MEQLIPTLAVVTAILGAPMPEASFSVEPVARPRSFSVFITDNRIDVTNRTLRRTIRTDSVRVQANLQRPEMYTDPAAWTDEEMNKAKMQQASAEEHCKVRLRAEGFLGEAMYCGPGFARFR